MEISAHGSPVVLRAIVAAALAAGARLAQPGEFTLRAYLHGRIDLVQAEAVADLVDAVDAAAGARRLRSTRRDADGAAARRSTPPAGRSSRGSKRRSIFPTRGITSSTRETTRELDAMLHAIDKLLADAARGRMIREGLTVAIVGRPNAGKSSLFNALAGAARAIVTDVPGTTRDLMTRADRDRRDPGDARRHRRHARAAGECDRGGGHLARPTGGGGRGRAHRRHRSLAADDAGRSRRA